MVGSGGPGLDYLQGLDYRMTNTLLALSRKIQMISWAGRYSLLRMLLDLTSTISNVQFAGVMHFVISVLDSRCSNAVQAMI